MAESKQLPGALNISVVHGDPYSKTLTITAGGEPYSLPTTGWRGQIRRRIGDTEVAGTITIDSSQAGAGIVQIEFPLLPVGSYKYDIECVGVRTFLGGSFSVTQDVSRDDD